MPGEYSNNFSQRNAGGTYFHPQTDHYISPFPGGPTGGGPTTTPVARFGEMVAGTSSPPLANKPVPAAGGGVTLTVAKDLSLPTGKGQTRTLYVDLAHLSKDSKFFLASTEKLTAEVIFDTPTAPLNTDPTYVWGLGLILKGGNKNTTGFQDEDPGDNLMGATYQFFNGGNIRFHGTDYIGPNTSDTALVSSGKYSDYANTDLHLSVSIWREPLKTKPSPNNEPISPGGPAGTATLRMVPQRRFPPHKPQTFTGRLLIQDRRTKSPYNDIEWINAVGFSIVNAGNNIDFISVRIKEFTLSVTPVHSTP